MSKVTHISQVSDKRAATIIRELSTRNQEGNTDAYNIAILGAAYYLVTSNYPDAPDAEYGGQYQSGSTYWYLPNGTLAIDPEMAKAALEAAKKEAQLRLDDLPHSTDSWSTEQHQHSSFASDPGFQWRGQHQAAEVIHHSRGIKSNTIESFHKRIASHLHLSPEKLCDYDWQQLGIDLEDCFGEFTSEIAEGTNCDNWEEVATSINDAAAEEVEDRTC